MSISVMFASILVYLLVWVRLAGMVLFNPFLSRNNVPVLVRFGIVLFLMLLIAPLQPASTVQAVAAMSDIEYMFAMFRELFIGLVYGFIFQLFYYFLFMAGDMMDTDFGLSMAKTFDPATSIQASFSSTLLTILFALYLFASGSFLALIHLFAESFTLIPLGASTFSTDILSFVLRLFTDIFLLVLRVIAPFMVAEFVLQASMGILMRFVPQVTVFVINFQLRIILGLILLFLFAPFIGQFIDNYITALFDSLSEATAVMAGSG